MVHPYLRRRDGIEPEVYPAPHPDFGPPDELKQVQGRTKGVPLFQEQAMKLAMVAAEFTPGELNELRKAMATFRRRGTIGRLEQKMVARMVERGYAPEFAARCFNQIKGFGEYGFPESHAASFAHLVYVSAWLKCHYPAVFACALLNSQPMGFYAPAQIVRDAQAHGVEVRAPDVSHSAWDATLESRDPIMSLRGSHFSLLPEGEGGAHRRRRWEDEGFGRQSPASHPLTLPLLRNGPFPLPSGEAKFASGSIAESEVAKGGEMQVALRLGLREVDGLKEEDARLLPWRGRSVASLHRAGLPVPALEKLAAADCFRSLGLDRRAALWEVKALARARPLPLFAFAAANDQGTEETVALPEMPLSEHVVDDYRTLKLSLKAHPMSFLRARCERERVTDNAGLKAARNGASIAVAGVVLVRQRPGSAKGVVFLTLEDEFAVANIVVWPPVLEAHRAVVMGSRLMLVRGRVQRTEDIIHVVAARIEDRTPWLALLSEGRGMPRAAPPHHPRNLRVVPRSRDFH
jgi:error-prone DNA polymerase